ncbi:MAG TPA: helix-turn-helix transcriptional regulator [Acidimicrobiales bacterium]|nr:helix-turn-helix transcriptional regulator [Acidimicrobiales bacterium]
MDRPALAAALRSYRARLSPADLGLPAGRRRRVAGLRREEVAAQAGISVDYLVRLEQGRGATPSQQVLTALARALRITDDERDHLFHLAGSAPPQPGHIVSTPQASTLRLLDRITDLPAVLIDAKGDVLAWNALATALLGDFSAWPPGRRNLTWQRFLGDGGWVALDPEEDERTAVESVASLRLVAARYPDDPGLVRLVDELRAGSPRFARLWAEGPVAKRRTSRKTVHHPQLGRLVLDCDALHLPDVDQRLIVYSAAPATPEAEALALLRVVGLQDLRGTPVEAPDPAS